MNKNIKLLITLLFTVFIFVVLFCVFTNTPKIQYALKAKELELIEKKVQKQLEQEALRKKLEQEKIKQEKLRQEKIEQERLEKEREEQKRIKEEKLKQERLEQERIKQEKLEQKRLEREKLERERLEKEKLEEEKIKQMQNAQKETKAQALTYPKVKIEKNKNNLVLSGAFSSQESVSGSEEILGKFSSSIKKTNIIIDDKINQDEHWIKVLENIAYVFEKNVEQGMLEFADNSIKLECKVLSKEAKKQLMLTLKNLENFGVKSNLSVKVESPQDRLQKAKKDIYDLFSSKKIRFQRGESEVSKDSYELLDAFVVILNKNPKISILIEGHTSSRGDSKMNQTLSLDRASTIKEYLVKKGIDKNRLETVGYGESRPAFSNETDMGKEKNRRVEFKIKGDE